MPSVPDIKLTRTDTTHDLSQKAEKRWIREYFRSAIPMLEQLFAITLQNANFSPPYVR